jgi:hypothetical protein
MVSFFWFRATLTIPDSQCPMTTPEVWVNGGLPPAAGRPSPAAIQGFNMPNRIVLRDPVSLGDKFKIAVFAISGPISAAPSNFLWFREAKIEFYR